MNTRDTFGFAAKGAWFEVLENTGTSVGEVGTMDVPKRVSYEIYKDPVTDDGTKKSAKGLVAVFEVLEADPTGKLHHKGYTMKDQCTPEEENTGLLQVIYEDGKFYNQTSLTEIRERLAKL